MEGGDDYRTTMAYFGGRLMHNLAPSKEKCLTQFGQLLDLPLNETGTHPLTDQDREIRDCKPAAACEGVPSAGQSENGNRPKTVQTVRL